MNIRPAAALTALALMVPMTTLAACSSGTDKPSAPPKASTVATQDTTPLNPGDYHVSFDGALSGALDKDAPAQCDTRDGEYRLTLTGKLNGASTVVEISNLNYKAGQIALKGSGITANITQSEVRKDWRNQGDQDGDGTITYNADGHTGSFDITVPEISYDTAAVLPNNPPLHLVARWSCGPMSSSS